MTWSPVTFVLFHKHRNIGTFVCSHPSVGLGIDCEKKEYIAEPGIIYSELKSAIRDSWRQDEHHVIATGLLQFQMWPCVLLDFFRHSVSRRALFCAACVNI